MKVATFVFFHTSERAGKYPPHAVDTLNGTHLVFSHTHSVMGKTP